MKLDFFRVPNYMKQFPFAHTLTLTYRVEDGAMEVRTRIDSLCSEPMPVAIGFHPYFQLTDSDREDWRLSVAARTHWILDSNTLPTGETQPITKILPDPANVAVKDVTLDDIFTDLERDARGLATMSLKGKAQQIDVVLGPKFKTILVLSRTGGGGRGRAGGGGTRGGTQSERASTKRHSGVRADGGDFEFDEPCSKRSVQGASIHRARRFVGGEFLGETQRVLKSEGGVASAPRPEVSVICRAFVLLTVLTVPTAFMPAQGRNPATATKSGEPAKSLQIYVVDTEGGKAALWISPTGETLLIDSGNPGGRDTDRHHGGDRGRRRHEDRLPADDALPRRPRRRHAGTGEPDSGRDVRRSRADRGRAGESEPPRTGPGIPGVVRRARTARPSTSSSSRATSCRSRASTGAS